MSDFSKFFRSASRQIAILAGLVGITFAAGIEWAEAAETGPAASGAMPGEFHVIFLFLLTIGVMAHMVVKPQQRTRMRLRPKKRRARRR